MLLRHRSSGTLVEIISLDKLFNPCLTEIVGICHAGEELQDPATYIKSEMIFPSGEPLPICWLDAHYRDLQNRLAIEDKKLINC
jgi:hypothetical protein